MSQGKIIKVAPDATALLAPLACKGEFDAYSTNLEMFDYLDENQTRGVTDFIPDYEQIPKSKKGPAILILAVTMLIVLLPIILLALLMGFIVNQIKFSKKLKAEL